MKTNLEKLNEIYEHLRSIGKVHTQKEFAEQIKTPDTNVSAAFNGVEKYLTDGFLEKVCKTYSDFFILDKDGEIIKIEKLSQIQNSYPLIDLKVAAGFGNDNFCIEKTDVKSYYVIPKFADKKIDFMIEVSGNSMYPKYSSGDVIACKIISENSFIQWNKPHVLATREQGLIVKRLKKSKIENCVLAVSDNTAYDEFDIPYNEIEGIALVVGCVRVE